MAFLADSCFDFGLNVLTTRVQRIDIIDSAQGAPTTYTEAVSTNSLGFTRTVTVGAPGDRAGGGREVIISSVNDGAVTGTGIAGMYAITDSDNQKLLAWGNLVTSQTVTSGNTFTLSGFTIGIPDPI